MRLDLTDGRSIADGRLPGPGRRDDDARPDLVGAAIIQSRRHELLDVATRGDGVEHAPRASRAGVSLYSPKELQTAPP